MDRLAEAEPRYIPSGKGSPAHHLSPTPQPVGFLVHKLGSRLRPSPGRFSCKPLLVSYLAIGLPRSIQKPRPFSTAEDVRLGPRLSVRPVGLRRPQTDSKAVAGSKLCQRARGRVSEREPTCGSKTSTQNGTLVYFHNLHGQNPIHLMRTRCVARISSSCSAMRCGTGKHDALPHVSARCT